MTPVFLSAEKVGHVLRDGRLKVFLPPLLLIVSALQVVSFAFGPAIPWKKTVKQPAVVTHQVRDDEDDGRTKIR